MVCPPRAAVLGSRTRVDAYNRSITKPLTGEPDAGDPPVRFGGRGKVQSLVPTPICADCDLVANAPALLFCLRQFLSERLVGGLGLVLLIEDQGLACAFDEIGN